MFRHAHHKNKHPLVFSCSYHSRKLVWSYVKCFRHTKNTLHHINSLRYYGIQIFEIVKRDRAKLNWGRSIFTFYYVPN